MTEKMNIENYKTDFFKIKKTSENIEIYVKKITWKGSHEFDISWIKTKKMKKDISDSEINAVIKTIVKEDNFFSTCLDCNQRILNDYMHNEKYCQACASKNHGVIY